MFAVAGYHAVVCDAFISYISDQLNWNLAYMTRFAFL